METHHLSEIRHRAIKIHSELSEKHASFIHSRYGDCVKTAFNYQQAQANSSKKFIQGKLLRISYDILLKESMKPIFSCKLPWKMAL